MNRPYNPSTEARRNFLKAAALGITGITALGGITAILINRARRNEGNEGINRYLKDLYNKVDLNRIIDEGEVRSEIKTHADFIREYMPYVNVGNPTKRDKAFISQLNDLDVYKSYITIDSKNLTEDQKRALNEFNSRELTKNDLEYIASIPWMDPNNLTNKDKIWLIQNARATAEAYNLININP